MVHANLDASADIRSGEELDAKSIETFLKDTLAGLDGDLSIRQFPSGYSNLTYHITIGDTELILRRPPFGKKAKSAHDMSREYRILSKLHPVFKYSPKPLIYCDDTHVIGCEFYVMERITGIILRKSLPPGLTLTQSEMHVLCENFIAVLLELHNLDYQTIGLSDFGKPEGYVARQIKGWIKRFRDARTPDVPDFEPIMQWLQDNMPPDTTPAAIIHNDFKFDNLVLNPRRPSEIIGVLDWEMTTIGDPLMDLGCSLAYWVQHDDDPDRIRTRMQATTEKNMLTREQIMTVYLEASGREVESFTFYYGFGLFRLSAILQQIYYRFYHGQTTDKRFAAFCDSVNVLERTLQSVLKKL